MSSISLAGIVQLCYKQSTCMKVSPAMNSFIVCFNAILPIFLVIALGFFAKRVGFIREE